MEQMSPLLQARLEQQQILNNSNESNNVQQLHTDLTQKPDAFESSTKHKQENNKSKIAKIIAIGAAITAAAAGIIYAVRKSKVDLKTAQAFFDESVKVTQGNNKFTSEASKTASEEADKFIENNPETFERIKKYLESVIHPKNATEIIPDGYVYHGTSLKSSKSIMENGISALAQKEGGNALPGLGRGVYTTPTLDLAQHYSSNGVVLPYKLSGNIAQLNDGVKDCRADIMGYIAKAVEPSLDAYSLPSEANQKTINLITPNVMNRALREMGYSSLYTPCGATKGLLSGVFGKLPENIDTAGQLVVYDGTKLQLDVEKLKEINPINKTNYKKFLDIK